MKIKTTFVCAALAAMLLLPTAAHAQADAKMNSFIDNLMSKMTLREKIGQLNLPVAGDITTGQAKSSDVAGKISRGEVGGLFNLKGVKSCKRLLLNKVVCAFL